jgi:hypothetical protein
LFAKASLLCFDLLNRQVCQFSMHCCLTCTAACAGAYTSVCSSKHVPNYVERSSELQEHGVQVIACLSVNGEGQGLKICAV